MIRWGRTGVDTFAVMRQRMICETEVALLTGLAAGQRVRRIPAMECGKGSFSPDFAKRFWEELLDLDAQEHSACAPRPFPRSASAGVRSAETPDDGQEVIQVDDAIPVAYT